MAMYTSDRFSGSDRSEPEDEVSQSIVQNLSRFIARSTYACGGVVKVQSLDRPLKNGNAFPVTIRWDFSDSITERLTLPTESDARAEAKMKKLLKTMQPASFGLEGKDVIDETYRKASKLDTSDFSTNFCPYEVGIIDVIGQALLPNDSREFQGIRAELYKLNVYQAPFGLFKPHVDTPRSDLQFGSLVVCLPCNHEGGQLIVRHQGHSMTFDWSGSTKDVQWAAFYSDCEHEVFEVTSGHRVTLTYNLFVRRGLGELAGHSQMLDVQQLPLYQEVKAALANPEFMSEGGNMGKYCSHAYAHNNNQSIQSLPAMLKGSDMITYEVFRSLGLPIFVRPILNVEEMAKAMYEHDAEEARTHDHVGDSLSELVVSYSGGHDDSNMKETLDDYPHQLHKISWMNGPTQGTESMQLAFLTYGNQAEVDWAYSFCALIFWVPEYEKRVKLAKKEGYSL